MMPDFNSNATFSLGYYMHKGCWSRLGAANSLRVQLLLAISSGLGWSRESDDGVEGASCLVLDDGVKSRHMMIGWEVEVLASP